MKAVKGKDSFQKFQNSTMDAWDDAPDDFMIDMANIKMSMADIKTTAEAVIESHSKQTRNANKHAGQYRISDQHCIPCVDFLLIKYLTVKLVILFC